MKEIIHKMKNMKQNVCLLAAALLAMSLPVKADNWMSRLPDNMYAALLSIPGAHDAATGSGFPTNGQILTLTLNGQVGPLCAQTQDIDMATQWSLGVRAFDLRPYVNDDTLNVNHGIVQTNLDFDEAMYLLRDSLKANPTEFAFIHLLYADDFDDDATEYKELLLDLLESDELKDYLIDFRRDLTVGDMRGKILIMSRDKYDSSPVGAFMTGWAGYIDWSAQTSGTIYGAGSDDMASSPLYMQDYSDTTDDGAEDDKVEAIETMLNFSTTQEVEDEDDIVWVFNFASAYADELSLFGYDLSLSDGYRENATYTHPAIIEYFQNNDPGPTGIVLCDYIGVDESVGSYADEDGNYTTYKTRGKEVLDTIINNNFNYLESICRPIYSKATNYITRILTLVENGEETINEECADVAEEYIAKLEVIRDSMEQLQAEADSLYAGYVITEEFEIDYSAARKEINAIIDEAEEAQALYDKQASGLLFQHRFASLYDESGTYEGTLGGSATLDTISGVTVVDLGESNGYFSFGSDVGEIIASLDSAYTISLNVFVSEDNSTIGSDGNFVFNFGNSSSSGYIFFGANTCRVSITQTNYGGEQTVNVGSALDKGEWINLVYRQDNTTGTIFINGEEKAEGTVSLHPSDLGNTTQNWLGRSPYSGDVYLVGAIYSDVRIYNIALPDDSVALLNETDDLIALRSEATTEALEELIASLDFDFSDVRSDIDFQTSFDNGITGSWASSDTTLIANNGQVTRPDVGSSDATCTLTLTLTLNGQSETIEYEATVKAQTSDADAVLTDIGDITLDGNLNNLSSDLTLASSTTEGSIIIWESDNEDYLTSTGKLVKLSSSGDERVTLTLTATAYKGEESASRTFDITIAYQDSCSYYLFIYFPSNDDENLYYALSNDGYNFTPLNNGQMVMASDTVAIKKGIRDPHILRGEDGKFYMVATDMRCADGWSSNRGIVMYKSDDMINWTHSTVNFPDRFADEWSAVTRVWAPETIWDPNYENEDGSLGRYLVYYSLLTSDGSLDYDKIYYSYANDDFTDLLTDPVYFYDRGSATIDGDIIFFDKDSLYHMIYKNEGEGGICQVTAKTLTAAEGEEPGSQWGDPSDPLQQTSVAVEGGGLYKLIASDEWVLMYDCYNSGYYQFCVTTDFETFTLVAQTTTSGAFTPRHGTVLPITAAEAQALVEAFPSDDLDEITLGSRGTSLKNDEAYWADDDTYYIPARHGTDLSAVDPMLYSTPGVEITPEGEQNFSDGAVTYTLAASWLNESKQVNVEIATEANPVIDDFLAEPEIIWSNQTGRFYIYPTTDGTNEPATIQAYSSANLVDWQLEDTILNVADIDFAGTALTSPAAEEIADEDYTYYIYYLTGDNIGVTSATSPIGPFRSHTQVTESAGNPDVFTDSTSAQSYLYWGEEELTVALLNDMTGYSETVSITPNTDEQLYGNDVNVFCRNGVYYFLWSVDDDASEDFHVAYGTSDAADNTITLADEPVILQSDTANKIYGPGRCSVIRVPGTDDWYIAYQRIATDYLDNEPEIHHEVCIDRLEFDADGNIIAVTPTRTGIDAVDMTNYILSNMGITTAIETAAPAESEVISVTYYSLGGINLGSTQPSARGLYIKVERKADGSVKSTKFMK